MESSGDFEKVEAGSLVKESLVVIGGKTCRVEKVMKTKVGNHGSEKVIIAAVGLSDNEKVEKAYGVFDLVDAPIVKRTEYTFSEFKDDFLDL